MQRSDGRSRSNSMRGFCGYTVARPAGRALSPGRRFHGKAQGVRMPGRPAIQNQSTARTRTRTGWKRQSTSSDAGPGSPVRAGSLPAFFGIGQRHPVFAHPRSDQVNRAGVANSTFAERCARKVPLDSRYRLVDYTMVRMRRPTHYNYLR